MTTLFPLLLLKAGEILERSTRFTLPSLGQKNFVQSTFLLVASMIRSAFTTLQVHTRRPSLLYLKHLQHSLSQLRHRLQCRLKIQLVLRRQSLSWRDRQLLQRQTFKRQRKKTKSLLGKNELARHGNVLEVDLLLKQSQPQQQDRQRQRLMEMRMQKRQQVPIRPEKVNIRSRSRRRLSYPIHSSSNRSYKTHNSQQNNRN